MSQTQVQLVGNVRTGAIFAGVVTATNVNVSGVITAASFSGSGDNLIFSPTVTSFSPVDGATGVNALSSPDISITYNQPISLGVGTITLRKSSASGDIVESYEVGVSTRATLSTQTLTIDPTNNFDYDQEYYVVLPVGTVKNNIGGNSVALDTYNFTTEAGPTLSSVSPGIGSTDINLDSNIVFTFDKNIRAGVGTITLRTVSAGGTIVESYDVSSSNRLTFSTNTLTIDPTSNLSVGTTYYAVVPNNAVAGYAGISTYNFTTVFFSLQSINPANGATNVGLSTNITLTFTSSPTRGTGTVLIRQDSTSGSIVESFDAASSNRISVSGNDWILDPTSSLGPSTSFYTIIPSTAIQNYVGLNTTGADSHSFTTRTDLGLSMDGGYLICKSGGTKWIVAPSTSEVSRQWGNRGDAVTTAQQVSGCTGWFVPSCGQLQNPGYICRTYWDSYCGSFPCLYWSDTFDPNSGGPFGIKFSDGSSCSNLASINGLRVRAFRCVTY